MRILVTLYAPPGVEFVGATGWDPTFVPAVGPDGENMAMVQRLIINPEQSFTGTFIMTAPDDSLDRDLSAYVTPMARKIPVTDFEFTC